MSISILWPCTGFTITADWADHMARPGYNRAYAGTDLARGECPLMGSQYGGKVLQAMWSTQGYGYTTFVEYSGKDGPVLRIRNAHQKNLSVKVGDIVDPTTILGTLDSTGNSTGNHTHFEVWLKIGGVWTNIDPLDPRYDVSLVYDPALLVPLEGDIPVPQPVFEIPQIPVLSVVMTSPVISQYLNLRANPYISGADIGNIYPGEEWQVVEAKTDSFSNVWLRIFRGTKIGWAAAYYGGEIYMVKK